MLRVLLTCTGDVFPKGLVAAHEELVQRGRTPVCADCFDGVEVALALRVFDFCVRVALSSNILRLFWSFVDIVDLHSSVGANVLQLLLKHLL